MFTKINTLVAVIAGVACLLTGQSEAQSCFAQSVVNLRLDAYHNLTWSARPDEPCLVAEYLVYIFHPDQPAEYAFSVNETSVDVSFLEVCEEWTFAVVPLSGNVMGGERRIISKIPLPLDADLSISDILVTQLPNMSYTQLQWNLSDPQLESCSLRYKVTIEMDGSPIIQDIYVDEKVLPLNFLAPCATHQIGVRATNVALPNVEGPLKSVVVDLPEMRQNPPILIDTHVGTTTANVSFTIESRVRNPCRLNQLLVEVERTAMYPINLSNEGERLPINVTIDSLKPDTTYVLKASVTNTAGRSEANNYEIHTLASDLDE